MDSDEARIRLLAIASDRLSKLPGAYRKFEGELADWRGCALLASAQAVPLGYEEGERLGHPGATAAIQSHMLSVVDRWAMAQGKPPRVKPLDVRLDTEAAANGPAHAETVGKASAQTAKRMPAALSLSRAHALKHRSEPLAEVLKMAASKALNASDWLSVWASLVELAQSPNRPAPLLGYTEGEGVKYQTDNADRPVRWLTRDALRKRFSRKH